MRIFIIEDEKGIRDILVESLQEEKYIVDTAEDGKKGLFLASTNNYGVILLDYSLPELSGKQVCLEIRRQGINTQIIMLTAKTQSDDKVEMLNLGADDYITKPFMFAELLARVRAMFRRPVEIKSEILKVGDLIIEVNNYKVRRKEEIYLTTKEFQILVYLARNMDKVISAEVLMENVWDMNVNVFSKTVKTHIMNLRRKIDKDQKSKLVHTVKGCGYLLKYRGK